MAHFIVVGAGQAGQSIVTNLRGQGFDGQITLIGDEAAVPYQRPPLSKAYLLGEMELDRLYLRPASYYADDNIDLRTSVTVTAIDPETKTVTLSKADGDLETLSYDALALATGSAPRRLPAAIGGDLKGVYTMRSLADADAVAPEFVAGKSVLIVGGGYIGLEAAAVAAKKGLNVTLVEMSERILQRVASKETSDYFRNLHESHGVKICEGTGLNRLIGEDAVTGAELSDGSTLDVDFVIVGVGIIPGTELAENAGLEIDNGIKTDLFARTSDPSIYAAGDCASYPSGGQQVRLESVGNAIDQGVIVAKNMLGQNVEYTPKPWFWSDQFDVKLQIAGLSTGHDQVVIREGEGTRSHWYFKDGQLIAIDAMGDTRGYMVAKRLIESGKTADPQSVADPSFELKALLKA
ncbi:3-phenylpropionate/trans-cinnamate dioxygenase ferredoxin reductase subunit [Pacificibacter maritimus]|uniref:3-phenylpropionate/trans-cinnamate dioxygenase ferredoxin reductase subunit n=1 Tax=Pacificibacter maritimus TaxID=762213 RepID=A0A3N4TXK6_9RHOB|nr:FAD-dependent oxidoreductase [Pacificibacter maritimus]RPE63182.1 3-phenylpropionate/trans-cinnamate dioxygenase ferredoxin reductase subunit [Pacificibacter maritimus]